MTDLKALIQNEYKDLTLGIEAGQIVAAYKKEQRKTATVTLSAFVCAFVLAASFFSMNPTALESFMRSTGSALSSFFSGDNSSANFTEPPAPSDSAVIGISETGNEQETEKETSALNTEQETDEPEGKVEMSPTEVETDVTQPEETVNTEQAEVTETDKKTTPDATEPETSAPKPKTDEVKTDTAKFGYVLISENEIKINKCIPKSTEIVVPEKIDGYTVREIGDSLFEGYYTVTEVRLPDTVTVIGKSAFKGLKKLSTVKMPESIRTIGASAFEGCTALSEINLYKVEKIGAAAFKDCVGLASVTVPATASCVETEAFAYCEGLKTAYINSDCNDNDSFTRGYAFRGCKKLETVNFGSSVKNIYSWQFYQCSALKNINFTSSLDHIYESAFSCCSALEKIDLSKGVTVIGSKAFYKCLSLNEVVLPNNLTTLNGKAFYGCKKLASVTIPKSVKTLESSCFGYSDDGKVKGFTIIGYTNSAARTYAVNNGFSFESIGSVPNATTVTLESHIAVLSVGDTYMIEYRVDFPNGKTTFESSDEAVATVDGEGNVTAVGQGKATVTVSNNGASGQLIVVVK